MNTMELYGLVLSMMKLANDTETKDSYFSSARYEISDFLTMFIRLVKEENITTRDELLESDFKDEFWLNSFALAGMISGFRRTYIMSGNNIWSFEDYRMELAFKIADRYESLVNAYQNNPDEFYINAYVRLMLMNMIYDNNRKNPDFYSSLDEPISTFDESLTLMDIFFSNADVEEEGICYSMVCEAAKILNNLSSKGPLFAIALALTGDLEKTLNATIKTADDFFNIYNNVIESFCHEYGISNSEMYKSSNLSDFAKDFDPVNCLNSAQISRWKYLGKNALGPLFGVDTSPKQVRKVKKKQK